MNQSNSFWKQLRESGVVSEEQPKSYEKTPWFILLMQGFAGWLAGLFLLGFFAVAISDLFFNDSIALLLFFGIACCGIAYAMLKNSDAQFMVQLSLSIHLCGQILLAFAIFESFDKWFSSSSFLLLGFVQLFLGFVMNDFIHRFLSYLFGLISILFGLNVMGVYGIGTAVCAGVFTYLWMHELELAKHRNRLEPLAISSGIALIISTGFLLSSRKWIGFWAKENPGWLFAYAPIISSICIALLFLFVLYKILKEYNIASKTKPALGIAAVALILLSFKIIGLSAGLLLLIIGFYKQRASLMAFGLIAIILFFSWYYYNLDTSLFNKSIILIISGLFSLYAWWRVKSSLSSNPPKEGFSLLPVDSLKWTGLFITVLTLALINWNIHQKESLLTSGETVILKLAPVDPRSIMQGDYMRLRFEVQNQIREHYDTLQKDLSYKERNNSSFNGYAKLTRDENNIASFNGILKDIEKSQNILKIPFRKRGFQVLLTTDAFYFQEGKAKHFEQAEYGEFKLSEDGEMILSHLLDKSLNRL
jgi:uncharacterized membrane-anchored protein